jgi:glycosyltransferase involved in cell wall biosynthesis
VVTIHDLGFRFFPASHPFVSRCYLELSTLWAARRATHLIAVSESTRRDLQRLYGLPTERVSVVYEGVSSHFQPVRDVATLSASLEHYGLEPGRYLLALGTIQPRKNLSALLSAFRQLIDSSALPKNCLLALVGRAGRSSGTLEAKIDELGLRAMIRRLGYVPDGNLPALYSGALAYVQPSLYEGFGLTVLEALACGAPVVASNTSALPEVVGPAGILADANNPAGISEAVARVAQDPALRAEMTEAGPRRAAEFSWEHCAERTLEVLGRVKGEG